MIDNTELITENIYNWNDLASKFRNSSILLGNGFSLNFSSSLNYKYLHQNFIENCSINSKTLFEQFGTQNFEIILKNIEITEKVLNILGKDSREVSAIRNEIRNGLIDSIRRIHPTANIINYGQTRFVSEQLKQFTNIFTTNYDLYLYYLILDTKGTFADYYFGEYNSSFKKFKKPDEMYTRHIYYMHGALFLFTDNISTLKIKKPTDGYLLDIITKEIENSAYPLFISEGTSSSKLSQINSSQYLSHCFDNFAIKQDNLVLFGQSLSEQDSHIAEIIDEKYKSVAISIKPSLFDNIGRLRAEKNRILSQFSKTSISFYNSDTLFDFAVR